MKVILRQEVGIFLYVLAAQNFKQIPSGNFLQLLPLDREDFFFASEALLFVKIRLAHFNNSLCENIAYAASSGYMLCCVDSSEVL